MLFWMFGRETMRKTTQIFVGWHTALATTLHESASTMWPVVEYGKGEGHDYGKKDPETGQAYYGRGFIQCTWRENYARADKELGLTGDDSCEWHADNQLKPEIAAPTLYRA